MLKPGGQIFISTFEESPLDQAYERLDNGKWAMYNNWRANSCFYKKENPMEEYKKVINEVGFVDIHVESEPEYLIPFNEEAFWGKYFSR